jgi:hypothetical protein
MGDKPEKTQKEVPQTSFGVYQQEVGSYTLGEHRFTPLAAVPVPNEVAEKADPEGSPVKFFPTEQKAADEVARLKEKFSRKAKA